MEEIAGLESTTTIRTGQVRNIGVHAMKAQAAFIRASSRSPHDPIRVKELRKPAVRFATEPKVA